MKAAEHVICTGERNCHGAEIPQDSVPLLHDGVALSLGYAVEDFPHPGDAVRQKVDSEVGRVYDPAEDNLDRVPTTSPFAQLLERHWITSEWGITVAKCKEDMINGVKKGLVDTPKLWVLCQGDCLGG